MEEKKDGTWTKTYTSEGVFIRSNSLGNKPVNIYGGDMIQPTISVDTIIDMMKQMQSKSAVNTDKSPALTITNNMDTSPIKTDTNTNKTDTKKTDMLKPKNA